jgi:hypothetical protein
VIGSAGFDAAVEVGIAAFCADGSATRTRAFDLALGAQLNFFADRPAGESVVADSQALLPGGMVGVRVFGLLVPVHDA